MGKLNGKCGVCGTPQDHEFNGVGGILKPRPAYTLEDFSYFPPAEYTLKCNRCGRFFQEN